MILEIQSHSRMIINWLLKQLTEEAIDHRIIFSHDVRSNQKTSSFLFSVPNIMLGMTISIKSNIAMSLGRNIQS